MISRSRCVIILVMIIFVTSKQIYIMLSERLSIISQYLSCEIVIFITIFCKTCRSIIIASNNIWRFQMSISYFFVKGFSMIPLKIRSCNNRDFEAFYRHNVDFTFKANMVIVASISSSIIGQPCQWVVSIFHVGQTSITPPCWINRRKSRRKIIPIRTEIGI